MTRKKTQTQTLISKKKTAGRQGQTETGGVFCTMPTVFVFQGREELCGPVPI